MRVKALTRGYYNDRIVEPDQVFELKNPAHFSPWMEALDEVPKASKPVKVKKKADATAPDFS